MDCQMCNSVTEEDKFHLPTCTAYTQERAKQNIKVHTEIDLLKLLKWPHILTMKYITAGLEKEENRQEKILRKGRQRSSPSLPRHN